MPTECGQLILNSTVISDVLACGGLWQDNVGDAACRELGDHTLTSKVLDDEVELECIEEQIQPDVEVKAGQTQ